MFRAAAWQGRLLAAPNGQLGASRWRLRLGKVHAIATPKGVATGIATVDANAAAEEARFGRMTVVSHDTRAPAAKRAPEAPEA